MTRRREFLRAGAVGAVGAALSGAAAKPSAAAQAPVKHQFKLKYAPHTSLFSNIPDEIDRLNEYAAHGFTAFECNGLLGWPMERVEKLKKRMDELKMELGVFVANPSGWNKAGMVDPSQREAFLAEVKSALPVHKVVGNSICTVITGPEIPGKYRPYQRLNVIESLKRAADVVSAAPDLTLVVEPLNPWVDHAGYFLNTSSEAYEIMKAVGSPQVKILFDIYHMQITEGNLINNIRATYDEIGSFQLADVPGRHEPYTGEINYREVFKAIYKLGFKGIVGMELGASVKSDPEGSLKVVAAMAEADKFEV